VGASLTWYLREEIFRLLVAPAEGGLSPFGGLPVFTAPTEMLGATIHLAMLGGGVVAFPVATAAVFSLASPLLSRKQRRFLLLFVPVLFVFFLGGAAFAYFVMLPVGLRFLLHFGEGIAIPMVRLTEYMSLVTALIFWLGVVFELPAAMFLLTKLRLMTHGRLRRYRKYVPAAAFVLSAIITPTFDVVNQVMVAAPIIVLYEVGLIFSWLAEGGHKLLARRIWNRMKWVARAVKKAAVWPVRWVWRQVRRIC